MEPSMAAVAEAHHRIANSLALLAGLVRLEAGRAGRVEAGLSAPDTGLLLDGIAARLAAVGRLHRRASRMPPEGRMPLKPYLQEVSDDLIAAFSSPERPLSVTHTGSDCDVPVRHGQDVGLILCEIFINALKHAHPRGMALAMRVDFALDADRRAVLTIRDDGAGLPDGFDPVRDGGLGFQVIRALAVQMDAPLQIASSREGLAFRLTLPAPAPA